MTDMLDQAVAAAITAREAGDTEGAAAKFKTAEIVAKLGEGEREVEAELEQEEAAEALAPAPDEASPDEGGPEHDMQAWSNDNVVFAANNLQETPEGRQMVEALGSEFPEAARLGNAGLEALQRVDPKIVALADKAMAVDPTLAAPFFQLLVNLGHAVTGARPRQTFSAKEAEPMSVDDTARDFKYRGVPNGDLRAELDRFLAEHPPGTESYLKNQDYVQALHKAIHGDKPVIGRNFRHV